MTIPWPGGFPQQGWQCPVCRRVYAPFCPTCFVCGQKETVTQKDTQPEPAKLVDPSPPHPFDRYGVLETSGVITISNPPSGLIGACGSSGTVVYKTIPNNVSYTLS